MTNPTAIVPGMIFYSFHSTERKEKVGFLDNTTLVLQVSGIFSLETSTQKVTMSKGEMILIRKNQLAQLTKHPGNEDHYQTIIISLRMAC